MKEKRSSQENKRQSKFTIWYNSDSGKRTVGAVYSIGAAVVIVGALFKIMHWPMASVLLSVGMLTEAILFTIGVFEKPHKEYEWDRVFSFDGEGQALAGAGSLPGAAKDGGTMAVAGKLNEKELASLSDGIKSLAETAKDLSSLSVAVGSAKKFTEHMEAATGVAAQYAEVQQSLNKVTGNLLASYEALSGDMNTVVDHTKQYADKVDGINKSLASLNAVYEIQLKNLQAQSEAVAMQAENARLLADSTNSVAVENKKVQQLTVEAGEEVKKYKDAAVQLTAQVVELNKVYGNMLNALS